MRGVGAVAVGAAGISAVLAALVGLSLAATHSVQPLREASLPEDAQRFTFDRRAWDGVPVDAVFPPVYHSTTAAPMLGAMRDFTRIGMGSPAGCAGAFDAGLARLLSAHPCGPVLRADYTDATRTLVATVGVALLGTGPADQRDLNAATTGRHDDLRPRSLVLPGTTAAGFGDAQRVAFRVLASSRAPLLCFAVVGFSDGRPASTVAGADALNQSGALLAAVDLEDMASTRVEAALDDLWARRK